MKQLLNMLEDVLWPRALICLCCERGTDGGLLCPACTQELRRLRLPPSEEAVQSVWLYSGCVAKLVRGLKDSCMADCAKLLAEGMAERVLDMQLPPDTVLTWVTMPAGRLRERGIDHGRLLCEELSQRTGLQVRRLLCRSRGGHTQRGLTKEQRQRNLVGRFSCDVEIDTPVLLIDDVLTTGATVQTCMEVLRSSGARDVYALTATHVTGLEKNV